MGEVKKGQEAWFCGVHSRDYVVISKPKSGWSHLYCVIHSVMHTVPFHPSNMITSLIPNFKQLQEAIMVLKESFSTEIATDILFSLKLCNLHTKMGNNQPCTSKC